MIANSVPTSIVKTRLLSIYSCLFFAATTWSTTAGVVVVAFRFGRDSAFATKDPINTPRTNNTRLTTATTHTGISKSSTKSSSLINGHKAGLPIMPRISEHALWLVFWFRVVWILCVVTCNVRGCCLESPFLHSFSPCDPRCPLACDDGAPPTTVRPSKAYTPYKHVVLLHASIHLPLIRDRIVCVKETIIRSDGCR